MVMILEEWKQLPQSMTDEVWQEREEETVKLRKEEQKL